MESSPSNSRGSFSRGGGRGGAGNNRGKKRNLGRSAWSKQKGDKRKQNDESQANKRQKLEDGNGEEVLPVYATKFSEEILKAEERRPKKKVAVLIGYSGTGYKGMQLAHDQKTIEGDLFQAFVAAGAISKANADDPKKSSFVRCARTDKGVHAAGNVISLKLIIEDENIVEKINENLNPQIRVWGLERTNNSFSAYQLVDSRIYEYLIPSHSFLPPHPSSFLGRKCIEWAEKTGSLETWKERQEEVEGFWEKVDNDTIKPILAEYDEETRDVLERAIWLKAEEDAAAVDQSNNNDNEKAASKTSLESSNPTEAAQTDEPASTEQDTDTIDIQARRQRAQMINEAVKKLRAAYVSAKRSYRIPDKRLDRIQDTLNLYEGTRNYHNYTVQKSYHDASAKRVIKSFIADPKRILIDGTEWLSLKVHGQSFMMHQIRKMVGMAALIVRCGADPSLIKSSYGPDNISIPKAPSLGLLLERPIFDSYNKRAANMGHQPVAFDKYMDSILEFKQREIYERMYRDEEKDNIFGNFFNHVDNFPSETFLFVTAGGIAATKERLERPASAKMADNMSESDDEDEEVQKNRDDAGNEG